MTRLPSLRVPNGVSDPPSRIKPCLHDTPPPSRRPDTGFQTLTLSIQPPASVHKPRALSGSSTGSSRAFGTVHPHRRFIQHSNLTALTCDLICKRTKQKTLYSTSRSAMCTMNVDSLFIHLFLNASLQRCAPHHRDSHNVLIHPWCLITGNLLSKQCPFFNTHYLPSSGYMAPQRHTIGW